MIAAGGVSTICAACGARFASRGRARYCPTCRPTVRAKKRTKYAIDERVKTLLTERYDTRVPGRVAELAAILEWTTCAVKKAARKLGLTRPWPKDRRAWTAEEEALVREWSGLRSSKWIGQRIGRGETSVILKQKRLRLSRRVREGGYTLGNVCECFGVDHHTVDLWVARGWLQAEKQGTAREHDIRRFPLEALREFACEHRSQYRLDRVDQEWFLALLFDDDDPEPPPLPAVPSRRCERCRDPFEPQSRYQKICPRCRQRPGRKPDPTPEEIRSRALAIRQAKGHVGDES